MYGILGELKVCHNYWKNKGGENPENQYARGGRILEIKNSKVKLSYMGWGSIEDIRCIQISISEV